MFKSKPRKPVLLAIAFKQFHCLEGIAGSVFRLLFALKDIAVVYLKHLCALTGSDCSTRRKPYNLKGVAFVALLSLGVSVTSLLFTSPGVSAATASTLNFQARLETASGAIVPDGDYDVAFRLYNAATSTGSTDSPSPSCGTDTNCLWEESYTYNSGSGGTDARIHVANGYLSANLGSITAFPTTIKWDQQLWVTMDIGGTASSGTITWDGQMSPRLQLTSVPYAFQARSSEQLQELQGSATDTLQFATDTTTSNTITLPDLGGSYGLLALQSATPGTAQTGNFDISGTGIAGTLEASTLDTASAGTLYVGTTNATGITLGQNVTFTNGASRSLVVAAASSGAGNQLTIQAGNGATGYAGGNLFLEAGANGTGSGTPGSVIIKANGGDSTTAFQVQNASGTTLVNVDTTNGTVGIGATPTGSDVPRLYLHQAVNDVYHGFEIQNSGSNRSFYEWVDGSNISHIDSGYTGNDTLAINAGNTGSGTGGVGIGTTSPGARLQIDTNSITTIGQIIQGASGQTADLFQANVAGSILFDISTTGTTITQNSTTAFIVRQTSTSTPTLWVSTASSGDSVIIGNGTSGDSTPVLLLLDSGTSSSDPSPVQGSMYYNGAKGAFRCSTGSAWVNCVNGVAYEFSTDAINSLATSAKSTASAIVVTPLYVSGQITVNNMYIRVSTALGAAGDVGIYDANGNLVLDGGSGSLAKTAAAQTITPAQTGSARILESGQYYAAATWNSTTGVIAGDPINAHVVPRSGYISSGGGLVLPSSISLSGITMDGNIYGITISN